MATFAIGAFFDAIGLQMYLKTTASKEFSCEFCEIFQSNLCCVKNVFIRSFSGPHFLAFGLNTERYKVTIRIQSECEKIRTRKTPNMDTFHAVLFTEHLHTDASATTAEFVQISSLGAL